MAAYKVIQDIEAEDKLLGPLTLKQFIFAGVAAAFAYAAFFTATKAGNVFWAIPFVPFVIAPAILAAPIGRDQPTDVWLAAQIRFYTKPRKRLWDQSGIKNLVTITVPKKIEKTYTNGLSQQEVQSRLRALADTIDSRGWAVKNVALNMYAAPSYNINGSDRLIDPSSLPQAVPTIDVSASDDIMDATNNPVAQNFDQMVNNATQAQRTAAIEQMQQAIDKANLDAYQAIAPPEDLAEQMAAENAQKTTVNTVKEPWFMRQPDPSQTTDDSAMFTPQTVTPGSDDDNDDDTSEDSSAPDEQALLEHIKQERKLNQQGWAHHKTIPTAEELAATEANRLAKEKLEQEQAAAEAREAMTAIEANKSKQQAMTALKNPDIVELANTNDLSVASVAHIAEHKNRTAKDDNEVIINLR